MMALQNSGSPGCCSPAAADSIADDVILDRGAELRPALKVCSNKSAEAALFHLDAVPRATAAGAHFTPELDLVDRDDHAVERWWRGLQSGAAVKPSALTRLPHPAAKRPTMQVQNAVMKENRKTMAGKVIFMRKKNHDDPLHFSENDYVRLEDGVSKTMESISKRGSYSIQADGKTSVREVGVRASSLKAATRSRRNGSSKCQNDGKKTSNQVREEQTAHPNYSKQKGVALMKPKPTPTRNKGDAMVQDQLKRGTKRKDKKKTTRSKRTLLPWAPNEIGSHSHDVHPKDLLMHEVLASIKLHLALRSDASYSEVAAEAAILLGLQYPKGATIRQKLNMALFEFRNM